MKLREVYTGGRGRAPHEIEPMGLGVASEGAGEQELVELMWLVDHLGQQPPDPDEGASQT